MTDERMDRALWPALRRLPQGSGVVFRHYETPRAERYLIARTVARICRRRKLLLAIGRDVDLARRVGAALVHNPDGTTGLLPISLAVHDGGQAKQARQRRAALVFISPLASTRSHPDAPILSREEALRLMRLAHAPAIALGGMDERKFRKLRVGGFAGYAGIDCWIRT